MKRKYGSVLVGSLAVLLLAACGGKGESAEMDFSIKDRYELDPSTPAWKLDKKEEVTKIVWYMNMDWTTLPFGEDITTKKIKEDLNVEIEFISGDDAKLNAMISGGDMPDIVTLNDKTSQAAIKADSWAQSLNDLAEKYDPYLMDVVTEDTFSWYALENGKTYGYPNYSNTTADYESGNIPINDVFVIQEEIYNSIGKPDLTTQDGFLTALELIKEKYPDKTPLGFSPLGDQAGPFTDKLQDLLGVPLETEDGKYYDRNMDKEYLSWLNTFSQAYRNDYISDDSFTDDGPTYDEKVKRGEYGMLLIAGVNGQGGNFTEFTKNTDSQYIAVDGPSSTSNRIPTLNATGISGWLINYVTKEAKDPAKVTQLFTYLISDEGQLLTKYGIEGVTFDYNSDNKIDILPEVKKMDIEDNEGYNKKYGLSRFNYFNNDRANALKVKEEGILTQIHDWGEGKLTPHFIVENIKPNPGTAEARANASIETKLNSTIISLIRSKDDSEFDKTLSEFEKFLESNKWDDIKKIKDEKMSENKKRLN